LCANAFEHASTEKRSEIPFDKAQGRLSLRSRMMGWTLARLYTAS
jgi:hypothetical protein